ncbi:MAG: methylated-DNA--[protein]-cysteine S-methyltransferase [Chloroflexota bacterium]
MSRPVSGTGLSYTTFDTKSGWVALLASSSGLRQLILPQPSPEAAIHMVLSAAGQLAIHISPEPPDSPFFASTVSQLRHYFHGEPVRLTGKIDLSGATDFQRRVWMAAYTIPYGKTRTYAWLARQSGCPRGARAVGQALSVNPLPLVIPCHRVVRCNGSIGGFSDGIETKRRLLRLEGALQ